MKRLANFLIVVGIVLYTICLLTFIKMETNYRIIFLIGENLICSGVLVLISLIDKKEK